MTITCTRRFQFCAGHRLVHHEGMCANLHGHNYVALITCQAPDLDGVGRVIDFSCIKEVVGKFIDANWDHKMVLNIEDYKGIAAIEALGDPYYLMDANPTAENMALHLRQVSHGLLNDRYGIDVIKVQLWETENCYAESMEQ